MDLNIKMYPKEIALFLGLFKQKKRTKQMKVQVNQPFYRQMPQEGSVLIHYWSAQDTEGQWELSWCVDTPTKEEVIGVAKGDITCSLCVINTIPFFCWKSEVKNRSTSKTTAIPWQECSFVLSKISASGAKERFEKMLLEFKVNLNLRPLIPLVGIDYGTNKVVALRAFTVSNSFAIAFIQAVLDCKLNKDEANKVQTEIEARLPVGAMTTQAIATCTAGD